MLARSAAVARDGNSNAVDPTSSHAPDGTSASNVTCQTPSTGADGNNSCQFPAPPALTDDLLIPSSPGPSSHETTPPSPTEDPRENTPGKIERAAPKRRQVRQASATGMSVESRSHVSSAMSQRTSAIATPSTQPTKGRKRKNEEDDMEEIGVMRMRAR
jgi:hypothetical protein